MSHIPAPQPPHSPPPPARLNSSQLRELSRQWRQRVDEDPEKVQRVATVLEWLAVQRETAAPASLPRPQQSTFWQGLASWGIRLSRLSHLRPAR